MALRTDDCDLRDVHFNMGSGSNGDYYITLTEYPNEKTPYGSKTFKQIHYRMATSGGFAKDHPKVRECVAALFRAMEEAGLNEFSAGPSQD